MEDPMLAEVAAQIIVACIFLGIAISFIGDLQFFDDVKPFKKLAQRVNKGVAAFAATAVVLMLFGRIIIVMAIVAGLAHVGWRFFNRVNTPPGGKP